MSAVTSGWMQLVNTPKGKEDQAYWLRCDMDKNASVGAAFKCDWRGCPTMHSFEAATTESSEGFYGTPLTLRGGYKCQMSEAVKNYMTFKLDKNFEVTQKTKCAIDKNWSFGFKQSFDSGKLAAKKEYDIGFSMTYKL